MDLSTITAAVDDLLTGGDATFAAELSALLGKAPTLIKSNRPWEQIPAQMLPVLVREQGDGQASTLAGGDDSGMVIGHMQQSFESDYDLALVWTEQDRDKAADQRAALPAILARLFMRHPQPGGADGAWLASWQPDQGARHPAQVWNARIHLEYVIEGTP